MRINGMGLIGIGLGVLGLAWSGYEHNKTKETCNKLDFSMEEVGRRSNIEIEQRIVDKAIEQAVERKVETMAYAASKRVQEDLRGEIDKQVRKAVADKYNRISEDVSEKIAERVATIDEASLREKITKKAEDKLLKKFEGCLEGLLGEFGTKLRTIANINDLIGGGSRDRDDGSIRLRLG